MTVDSQSASDSDPFTVSVGQRWHERCSGSATWNASTRTLTSGRIIDVERLPDRVAVEDVDQDLVAGCAVSRELDATLAAREIEEAG